MLCNTYYLLLGSRDLELCVAIENNTGKLVFKGTFCDFLGKSEKVQNNHNNRKHKEETLREVPVHEASLEMATKINEGML